MTMDEECDPKTPSLRPMFCSLGVITRGDGSVILCQGDSTVACAVYGPGEVRVTKELIDKAVVEVVFKPRMGMPGVADKAREVMIQSTCTAAILTILHPRTSISINLQEMQADGCLVSTCINAACLALIDASVSMKFLVAAVTMVVNKDGSILCDPTQKQMSQSAASLLFVFSNRQECGVPGLVTSHTEGVVDQIKLQECLSAASIASQSLFQFYKKTIAKKFSKDEHL
eukprot:GFUD01008898.1.p1 GENE.GFUD01008898.1~~GFUD01008898.1.p1  ORF type:complete len:229 (-),score=60.50 GFUD01008898.1:84-770(-)